MKWRVYKTLWGWWQAMPIHSIRPWTIDAHRCAVGPEDTGVFATHAEAIAYATSEYQVYRNGWLP